MLGTLTAVGGTKAYCEDVRNALLVFYGDGMSVDMSGVTGDAGRMGYEFNDISPLHNANFVGAGGTFNE